MPSASLISSTISLNVYASWVPTLYTPVSSWSAANSQARATSETWVKSGSGCRRRTARATRRWRSCRRTARPCSRTRLCVPRCRQTLDTRRRIAGRPCSCRSGSCSTRRNALGRAWRFLRRCVIVRPCRRVTARTCSHRTMRLKRRRRCHSRSGTLARQC